MGAKAEIGWTTEGDDGVKRHVFAQRVGGEWRFRRDEVLAYLLRDDRLGDLLAPMIGRATTTPPRLARA